MASLRLARKVAQTIAEWEIVVRSEGRPISAEEFAHWWRESPATAYRRLALFRELYPETEFPHDLMRPLLEELEAKS